jgi:hypothetical protein
MNMRNMTREELSTLPGQALQLAHLLVLKGAKFAYNHKREAKLQHYGALVDYALVEMGERGISPLPKAQQLMEKYHLG